MDTYGDGVYITMPSGETDGYVSKQPLHKLYARKVEREILRYGVDRAMERWRVVCDYMQTESWWPPVACAVEEVFDDAYNERKYKQDSAIYGLAVTVPLVPANAQREGQQSPLSAKEKEMVSQLTPMFYGSDEDAREFLTSIQGAKAREIAEIVKKWVADKKMSELSCRRPLWRVLHDCGFLDITESYWNKLLC